MPETIKTGRVAGQRASEILKAGGIVVYPTETMYGLGALATNHEAVNKIFQIKQRPPEKLLPVIVCSFNQAQKYFMFSKTDLKLARRFWPGPLSFVLKTKSKKVRAALKSAYVAVRFSSGRLAASIARCAGAPIVSTSANISGKPGCFTLSAVKKQFTHTAIKPDLYIDGGQLKKSLPSTVIRTKDSKMITFREGKIPVKVLRRIL
jgi:L-threonylcarbamoyladenylate synthase